MIDAAPQKAKPKKPISILTSSIRVIKWLVLSAIVFLSGSVLIDSLVPTFYREVSIYTALCTPIDHQFWNCRSSGGRLSPSTVTRYRIDVVAQSVVEFGNWPSSTYYFKKCTVADRLNWSCHYNDGSAIVEVSSGTFRSTILAEGDKWIDEMQLTKATGQVSFLEWIALFIFN